MQPMGRLIYSLSVSLDGYAAGPDGSLEAFDVDEEIHAWFNDRARETAAFLYGRRIYELMAGYWPLAGTDPDAPPVIRDFARIWIRTPKIVFSSTLREAPWAERLVRGDPLAELTRLRATYDGDLDLGGPTLASAFVSAGLVDEYRLVVHPVVLGVGIPFFRDVPAPIPLRLVDTRRFAGGAVLLVYRPA